MGYKLIKYKCMHVNIYNNMTFVSSVLTMVCAPEPPPHKPQPSSPALGSLGTYMSAG